MSIRHGMPSLAITLVLSILISRLYLRLTRSRRSTNSCSCDSEVANGMMSSNRSRISLITVTWSSVSGERSLPFTYRNLGNFRGFYSRNGKSQKSRFAAGTPLALPIIDAGYVQKRDPWPVGVSHEDPSKQHQNGGLGAISPFKRKFSEFFY